MNLTLLELRRLVAMVYRVVFVLPAVLLLAGIGAIFPPAEAQASPVQDSLPPVALVRATVANAVAAANDGSVKYMFRSCKKTPQGSQTRIYVETKEAVAGMTVAYNDHPLNPQQIQNEEGRLAGLVGSREQLQRKQKQEKEEADHTLRIVKALPDAFLFDDDGTELGTATTGREGKPLVRLKFRPNPSYRPPTHVEDVLVGMQGVLLIDAEMQRIARIDGTLFKEVTFGWGILGHLDKGGHFVVQQQEVDGSWEVSRMRLEFTGKILLFKNISMKSEEVFSNFKRVPADTTFAEGVKMLEQEQAKPSLNGAETARASRKGQQ